MRSLLLLTKIMKPPVDAQTPMKKKFKLVNLLLAVLEMFCTRRQKGYHIDNVKLGNETPE